MSPGFEIANKDGIWRARLRGPFLGLDTTSSLSNISPLALPLVENFDIEENGSLVTRKGFTSLLTAPWTGRMIHNGIEYRTGSTIKLLVAGREAAAGTGAFGSVDAAFAAITNISTGLNVQRPSLVQIKNLLFFYNGTDDFVYDGSGTRQIGITPPIAAPTLNTTTNGSLTVGAIYSYAYTYYNSVTGAESSPSSLYTSAAIGADPNDGLVLNVTAGTATTADTIRLYRTVANGSVLFLDTTAAIAATTINSTQADAGLGKQLELDNTRPSVYGKFKYATGIANRVYTTGLSTNPNRVFASAIYSEGAHAESFPANHFADCESTRGATDGNTGLGYAGTIPIVMKKYSIGRIDKIGFDDFSSSADPVFFQYTQISNAVTCLSHWGGCPVYNEWLWIGRDNIYATDGVAIRTVADSILPTLRALNLTWDDSISVFNDLQKQRVTFSVKTSGSSTPNYQIVGKYGIPGDTGLPNFRWTIYKQGSNTVTYPSIQAGCFFESTEFDGTRRILMGNALLNGKLYNFGSGTSDDGSAIYYKVRFAPIDYGFPEEEKVYFKDILTIVGDGTNYSPLVKSFYNYSLTESESQAVSLYSNGAVWGAFLWGVGSWGSNAPLIRGHDSHMKAYQKQVQVEHTGLNQPTTIYALVMLAQPTVFRG